MKTVKEYIYDEIKNLIFVGKLRPGQRFAYEDIQKRLDVSVIPIREAVSALKAEGFVDIVSRRGVYIRDLQESEIKEIYFLRRILEPIALKEAILNMNDDELHELKGIAERIKKSEKDENLKLLLLQNKDFHLYLYNLSKKQYLVKLIQQLWIWTAPYRSLYHKISKQKNPSRDLHEIIISACENKKPEIAIKAMLKHFENAENELRKLARARRTLKT